MSATILRDILPWVTPPVIGAVIGYVTNDIAIRMLFRPLAPIRLFGLRLPFTPGIFPKERHALSRSIGRMVSRELITEEALRTQIRSEKARAALAQSVARLSAQVLATPLSALSGAGAAVLAASLRDLLEGLLSGLLGSRAFLYAVRDIVSRSVSTVLGRKPREAFGQFDLKQLVTGRLLPLLADEKTRRSLAASLASAVGERGAGMLSDELIAALSSLLEPFLPAAVERLLEWLKSAETRALMESRGRVLLSKILDKLNILQRFLLSAGNYDRRLQEKMPEIVEDAIKAVEEIARDPASQMKVLELLARAARDWRDGSAAGSSVAHDRSRAQPARAIALLVEGFLARMEDPLARAQVWEFIEKRFLGGDRTLGSIARATLGVSDAEVADFLSNQALAWLSRSETAAILSQQILSLASRFLEDNAQVPLGSLLRMDDARKEKLDGFLHEKLVDLVEAKLPEILKGVDVEQLVVQKIDGLDVRDVERILLQVIATHLKWIDVFGAILGFLIGLIQVVLRLLRLT